MIKFDVESFRAAITEGIERVAACIGEDELRAVGFAGAEILRDQAKQNARFHVKTGTIYRSIIVKRVEEESDSNTRQTYKITVRKGNFGGADAFYWRFVEDGHKFVPRNKKISKKTGKKIGWKAHRAAAELEYGTASAPAYPFMRPAYTSHRQVAVDMMSAKLAELIKRNLGGG